MFGVEQSFDSDVSVLEKKEKIIITGGTEGLGHVIADDLAEQQNDVVICARNVGKIEEARDSGKFTSAYALDLADRHATKKFIRDSIDDLDGLDCLILNAAVTGLTEDEEYVFKVNEIAQVLLTKEAAGELRKNSGCVVFLTSSAKNIQGIEAYGNSKNKMEEWLKKFADKPENQGILFFSVIPGSCNTRMHEDVLNHGEGEVKKRTEALLQSGALRDPEIVGKIISKMASSRQKFNPANGEYDIAINQCEIVAISDANIEAEKSQLAIAV